MSKYLDEAMKIVQENDPFKKNVTESTHRWANEVTFLPFPEGSGEEFEEYFHDYMGNDNPIYLDVTGGIVVKAGEAKSWAKDITRAWKSWQ